MIETNDHGPRSFALVANAAPAFLALALIAQAAVLEGCRGGCGSRQADAGSVAAPADQGEAPGVDPGPASEVVEIRADDGLVLVADLTACRDPGAPAVVMVAGPSRTRGSWDGLAKAIRARLGAGLLAVDPRGTGASTVRGKEAVLAGAFGKDDWEAVAADGPAVARWIATHMAGAGVGAAGDGRGGADAGRKVVLVGESFGATVATRWAAAVRAGGLDVVALVLLSPGASMHGVDLWKPLVALDLGDVFVAAAEDGISWETAGSIAGLGGGSPTARLYPNVSGHGLDLVSSNPDLKKEIVEFIAKRSGEGAGSGRSPDAGGDDALDE